MEKRKPLTSGRAGCSRPDPERVAFCGLGIMGAPMAANLVKAGYELSVYTRTHEKAERFAAEHEGARAAASPAEAAEGAAAFITIVPDAPQVEEVLFGAGGALERRDEAALLIDMSTVAPTAARAIAERVAPRDFVEAPVSGSKPKAEDGTLTIMAGGTEEAFAQARPLLEAMGRLVLRVGPQGHGAMTKVIANTVTAINAAAVAEALGMVRRAGVDPDAFLEVAGSGSSASTMLELKARPMLEGRFDALFKLEHMLKDVRHCLAEARALGVELRLAEVAERMYAAAVAEGHGELDFAAVATVAG
jgi:3-hydroxyisobutyrate dehydrogenase-like beta-hydroxyacid dehydrogenase